AAPGAQHPGGHTGAVVRGADGARRRPPSHRGRHRRRLRPPRRTEVMDPVEVFVADEQAEVAVDALRWVRLARMVLEEQGVRGDAELSMLFVDEKSMADLNERFLGRDGPTDVLAFPMDDELIESGRQPDQGGRGPGSPAEPSDAPILVGDVVICPKVAERQALDHNIPVDDEM